MLGLAGAPKQLMARQPRRGVKEAGGRGAEPEGKGKPTKKDNEEAGIFF